VRGEEGLDPEPADLEGARRGVGLGPLAAAEVGAAGGEGALGEVDGRAVPPRENTHPAGVVAVVVRDQDGVDLRGAGARLLEPRLQVAGAEAGVHQDARAPFAVDGFHQHRVARATAAEAAHPHRARFS
jgi:hypothetical protein